MNIHFRLVEFNRYEFMSQMIILPAIHTHLDSVFDYF